MQCTQYWVPCRAASLVSHRTCTLPTPPHTYIHTYTHPSAPAPRTPQPRRQPGRHYRGLQHCWGLRHCWRRRRARRPAAAAAAAAAARAGRRLGGRWRADAHAGGWGGRGGGPGGSCGGGGGGGGAEAVGRRSRVYAACCYSCVLQGHRCYTAGACREQDRAAGVQAHAAAATGSRAAGLLAGPGRWVLAAESAAPIHTCRPYPPTYLPAACLPAPDAHAPPTHAHTHTHTHTHAHTHTHTHTHTHAHTRARRARTAWATTRWAPATAAARSSR
mgnify:CR=1 FL=1